MTTAETYIPDVQTAAERLIRWDRIRNTAAKILRFDITAPQQVPEESRAWAVGDPRAIPSLIVAVGVGRATRNFCTVVNDELGANRLPPEDMLAPDRLAGGHPRDPLIEFPNGLILRSVAAAEHILDQAGSGAARI